MLDIGCDSGDSRLTIHESHALFSYDDDPALRHFTLTAFMWPGISATVFYFLKLNKVIANAQFYI
jgi:hypothetical protein